ncbi:MAG: alpha-N-arabinofuranosidase [Phycisphaerales bacterium]|nr:alpha-N-arabinofuranosidase [Phycisphaerales bacterium]
MLADRKFFTPVGEGDSPWQPIGTAAGRVSMDAGHAFVGEHAVRLLLRKGDAESGIAQKGLGLIEGRRYVGHVWLAGEGTTEGVELSLHWGPGEHDCVVAPVTRLTSEYARTGFGFTAGKSTDDGSLWITGSGEGTVYVGTVSLMPADNVEGFRRDTLELLKELDAPVYRWPGGNFVSGYDWRDGIGDRDRRPPRKNPAWKGIEHNDVGIHEFMDLCRLLGTEPYVAINAGLGSADNAAAELEYLNGGRDTPMGRLRGEHGHPEPWGVRFIGVGNEMYGSWQLGNVPLGDYTRRHNEFVDRLRKVDPTAKIVAVGAVGDWSRTMLRDCADHMDLMSEHVYWQERPGLLSHVMQAPASLRAIAEAHRAYAKEVPGLQGQGIRVCQDEWNYWYGPEVFGELGTRYFMKDALGCAAALQEFGRDSDVFFMANYAQTVNVIGAIKTTPTAAAMETTGLVLSLYRHHLGVVPCATESTPTLDALAAWSEDRKTLTIGVVNASTAPAKIDLALTGADLAEAGRCWEIASDDPMAFNDPAGARPIQIRERAASRAGDTLSVAPCSVTLFAFPVR